MKTRIVLVLVALPVGLFVGESAHSRQQGILPFDVVNGLNVGALTRDARKSCGQCHTDPGRNAAPGAVHVGVLPFARVLPGGVTTNISVVTASTVPSMSGGFVAEVTAGTLVGGLTTRTNAAGTAITHVDNSRRTWHFNYRTPTTPGLTELYVVVNHGNNDFPRPQSNAADRYAFNGWRNTSNFCTPIRMYTNAPGNASVGEGCADGFGNFPVLGAPLTPRIGQPWRLEAHGVPPTAPLLLMVGAGGGFPRVDLTPLGARGCYLYQPMHIQAQFATTGGNAEQGQGTFTLPATIPNDPNLRGRTLTFQVGVVDPNSRQRFPFMTTNAIETTIR